jgi:ADP-heptose:LPS heptosyltransferase
VILLVPTLRALKTAFPQCRLDVLVDHRYEAILSMCSAVDRVLPVNRLAMRESSKLLAFREIVRVAEKLRRERYDLVLDCHSFRETHLLTWYSRAVRRLGLKRVTSPYLPFCFNMGPVLENDAAHVSAVFLSMLEPLGIASGSSEPALDVPFAEVEQARNFLEQNGVLRKALLVGLNVGAGSQSRTWPQQRFAELSARILRTYSQARIVLFSGPGEDAISVRVSDRLNSERIVAAPNLPLVKLAATMSQCSILVSNDTGPMHLGPALGVPTLGLFSIARPDHYHPLGRTSRWVRSTPIETLSVDLVWKNVTEMLQATQTQGQ